jgi:glycosyltransferase involved in cell wall biosynthesis
LVSDIAMIVTCHDTYLKWLPEAMASIDHQIPTPAERLAIFDRCQAPAVKDGWRFIEGDWGHPSRARNAGIAATRAPWLVFWDADNVMAEGYIAAMQRAIDRASSDCGIIYPDIQLCDERLTRQTYWTLPPWDYWGMRAENCIDTASAWRRAAIEIAGGWLDRTEAFEDYALALDITALGWKAMKLDGPPILMRIHSEGRMQRQSSNGGTVTDLWRARSLAMVSLLAGRDATFGRWVNFLLHADLPCKIGLYVVDNSGRPDFMRMAFDACQRIAGVRGLSHVTFVSSGQPYQAAPSEIYLEKTRHLHIAQLYASVLPRVSEDLVLTLEDDIDPPLDAVRRLVEDIGYGTRDNIGVVAATYAMPHNASEVCAGYGPDGWGPTVRWEGLPDEPFDVGCVGGGCTVWANGALHGYPLHVRWNELLGWDAVLCTAMRQRGYRVRLHGGVRCQHYVHGRMQDGGQRCEPTTAQEAHKMSDTNQQARIGWEGDNLPLAESLMGEWQQALAGDQQAQAQWQIDEGGKWGWQSDGVSVWSGGAEWSALSWQRCGAASLKDLKNFIVEVTISGKAEAAGLSFGPYKDFLAGLDGNAGARHLQLEVDTGGGYWAFRVDGQLMDRHWWDTAIRGLDDLVDGTLTLKAKRAEHVLFQDLAIHTFQSSCQLSVIITCYRFLQRLRVSMRNWCHQSLPSGLYEVLVVNPHSPDGTHEHLAAVARSYPLVRVREVAVESHLATNKGVMINHAVEASHGDWIWLTDADCLFSPDCAAHVMSQVGGRPQRLFYGQRRYLSANQTAALLANRIDGLRDFAALCQSATAREPQNAPVGYTQIVHRSTLGRVRYREGVNHFAESDMMFIEHCRRHGIMPEQLDGLFCLHLDHPFAWYGTHAFL